MKAALASGALLLIGFLLETFTPTPFGWIIPIYLASFGFGGYDAAKHGVKAALKLRFDIEFLMVVAAIGAAILGAWAEGALLLFLFSLGHALEHMAMDKARNAMHALGEITPKTALLKTASGTKEVPVISLKVGDHVIVRAGDRLPVDGTVAEGNSTIDQAAITGESVPVDVTIASKVFAGSVNGEGTLTIETTKLAKDSTIARIVKMVQEAQTQKSTSQRFTDSFSKFFVPISLIFVALVIAVPSILSFATGDSILLKLALKPSDAFLRGMTILVAASPCALAISTPAAVLSGIAQAARNGILLKGGVHLENLGTVKTVAFDKTGTLTKGTPKVTDVVADDVPTLVRVAASAESASSHPLAEAIVDYAEGAGVTFSPGEDGKALPGNGFQATVDGKAVLIGKPDLFTLTNAWSAKVSRLQGEGKTVILVQQEGLILGAIAIADEVRPEAKRIVSTLKSKGINVVMLTGDNEAVGKAVGDKIGIETVHANLLPEEKVAKIRELQADGPIAMVGDGINDAPAMASATVGIAMAARGTDVAMETADVALMADSLEKLPFAVGVSKASRRIIKQNLFASLGTIAFLIPFALFGLAGIGIAIVFHEGSTLIVVANALRLLKFGGNQ
ncbi:MAG: heavy metal translocating P-type ATPase [Thermoplasmatota archaeon]